MAENEKPIVLYEKVDGKYNIAKDEIL